LHQRKKENEKKKFKKREIGSGVNMGHDDDKEEEEKAIIALDEGDIAILKTYVGYFRLFFSFFFFFFFFFFASLFFADVWIGFGTIQQEHQKHRE
jgi:hypothetical protein